MLEKSHLWQALHADLTACRQCPKMVGTPVHGQVTTSRILLLGQAPGPHEATRGRPFAHTAGKTLFRWMEEATGVNEVLFRQKVYMTAVARCYPGKSKGGGDRVPDREEIANCSRFLVREMALIEPRLLIAIGNLAIKQVLGLEIYGADKRLVDVVGQVHTANYLGFTTDVVCLPHPSGLSSWPRVEPGKTLLQHSLALIKNHPEWQATFAST